MNVSKDTTSLQETIIKETSMNKMENACVNVVEENNKLVDEAKNLWAELEEEVDAHEQSFYHKFGLKDSPGLLDSFKAKVEYLKLHFTKKVVMEEGSTRSASGPYAAVTYLTKVLKEVQVVVRDHGVALEFFRELFKRQEVQLTEVKELVEGPGVHNHDWMVEEVAKQVEVKVKEVTNKITSMEEQLEVVKGDNLLLKKENKELKEEVDETRQRGMKGNIVISAPPGRDGVSKFLPRPMPGGGRMETQVEVGQRMIQDTSGFQVKKEEVAAFHKMPNTENSWIMTIKRSPEGAWEALSAAMLCGKWQDGEYFENTGVYLSFQLTKLRSKVLHQVRLARKEKLLERFSVNQNGRITILRTKPPRTEPGQPREKEHWEVVKDVEGLQRLLPQASFPLIDPRQEEQARRPRVAQPTGQ